MFTRILLAIAALCGGAFGQAATSPAAAPPATQPASTVSYFAAAGASAGPRLSGWASFAICTAGKTCSYTTLTQTPGGSTTKTGVTYDIWSKGKFTVKALVDGGAALSGTGSLGAAFSGGLLVSYPLSKSGLIAIAVVRINKGAGATLSATQPSYEFGFGRRF